jgi:hypothetical protein
MFTKPPLSVSALSLQHCAQQSVAIIAGACSAYALGVDFQGLTWGRGAVAGCKGRPLSWPRALSLLRAATRLTTKTRRPSCLTQIPASHRWPAQSHLGIELLRTRDLVKTCQRTFVKLKDIVRLPFHVCCCLVQILPDKGCRLRRFLCTASPLSKVSQPWVTTWCTPSSSGRQAAAV